MPIISDLEIIKSAIIYGDLDDAMSLIRKRKKSLSYEIKARPTEKALQYSRFMDSLEKLLAGEISLKEFKGIAESLDKLAGSLDISGDTSLMLDSLFYLLEYSLDRYNIRFPSYDGKRCDDR